MDRHKRSAKTIRLDERDREAILAIRDYYGLVSDNDVIRFVLRKVQREIESTPPLPQTRTRHSSRPVERDGPPASE